MAEPWEIKAAEARAEMAELPVNEQTYAYGGPVMPGNIYDRRMFRMANGGMMPPMTAGPPMQPAVPPQGALPPELAAMLGTGGGGGGGMPPEPVSYTHLTLPTNREV